MTDMADWDLTRLLAEWPYEPGRILARRITGGDGRAKLQLRIDLGVMQMEMDGRPDGLRPEGADSLLDYQKDRLSRYVSQSGASAGFVLSADECRALREEAVQYYHRYVALNAIGEYAGVVRDAGRNLEVLDLCRDHAALQSDRVMLEQFRPALITMQARAEAELALADSLPNQALAALDRGLAKIRTIFEEAGRPEAFDDDNAVQLLRGMRDALVPRLPASQRVELEERLRAALDAENYELAAILRDEIRLLNA
ncbi:MAG: UvrB/UvrC motif-containing protein [Phycisphaerales bacterium]|nr:MAG: UvrB/UvrC motif-containing protein [Phycisphaerales bacterium]